MSEQKKIPVEYTINLFETDGSNNEKSKSEEQKKDLNNLSKIRFEIPGTFFIAKSVSDFNSILKGFNDHIKSIEIKGGVILSKLKSNELCLKTCRKIAKEKLLTMKTKEDIFSILSYDNTNDEVLIECLKKLKELNINKIEEYKYCLPNIWRGNNNKEYENLENIFNIKFIFNELSDVKQKFKSLLKSLLDLSNLYKEKSKNINKLIYGINKNGAIYISGEFKDSDLYLKGQKFLELYPLMKDFKNFKNIQPFEYNDNKILYFGFLINSFYSFIVEEENENIKILTKYLDLIYFCNKLIHSLISDLNKNIDYKDEFFIKIRFLFLIFESNSKKYQILSKNFANHLFDKKHTFLKKNAEEFNNNRTSLDKIDKVSNIYNITYNFLEIIIEECSVKYKYNEYPEILSNKLTYADDLLSPSWTYNSLSNFQIHNFLEEDDIKYLKDLLAQILRSNFWKNLEDQYINKEFYEGYLFDDDNNIKEFIDNIIFVPFYAQDLCISGFTCSDDLKIFISGYPYTNYIHFGNYKLYKILNLSLLVIILLHECIHFSKRKLYFLTCGLIDRETYLNEKKEEGGYIFEKLLLGWNERNDDEQNYFNKNIMLKSKKLNIETALKLLNPNTYKYDIKGVRDILYNYHNEEAYGVLLNDYLNEIGLNDKNKLNQFIEDNKKITINASRNYNEGAYIEYIGSNHLECFSNQKHKNNSKFY